MAEGPGIVRSCFAGANIALFIGYEDSFIYLRIMRKHTCTVLVLALAFLCLAAIPAGAQESLGIFNSPKGFGAEVRFPERGGAFHMARVFVDIYGVATSRCSYPGYRAIFSRQYILGQRQFDGGKATLYAGPGITAGYVRDHDKGRGVDLSSLVSDNEGFVLALNGDIGCRFDFGRLISLDLSFATDLGLHMRRNENEPDFFALNASIYNNGLIQTICPQLSIIFNLR